MGVIILEALRNNKAELNERCENIRWAAVKHTFPLKVCAGFWPLTYSSVRDDLKHTLLGPIVSSTNVGLGLCLFSDQVPMKDGEQSRDIPQSCASPGANAFATRWLLGERLSR